MNQEGLVKNLYANLILLLMITVATETIQNGWQCEHFLRSCDLFIFIAFNKPRGAQTPHKRRTRVYNDYS